MRVLFFIFFIFSFLFSITLEDVKAWEDIGQYNRICQNSVRDLFVNKQNVAVANMYAKACLKMDKINDLIIPIVMLYKTKEERENAAFYSTILFQKKMLYLALIDNVDISNIRTLKVDYILSNVFDKFIKKEYLYKDNIYKISLNDNINCDLFIKKEDEIDKMVIVVYKNKKIISIKKYW